MILCDIGNSRMHLFDGTAVTHLDHEEGLRRFGGERLCFISVHEGMRRRIAREAPGWVDLSDVRVLPTPYEGLGADRQAACLGIGHGVVVDAGSAVTVDVMEKGRHLGGWIWPGLAALRRAYATISSRLDRPLEPRRLPEGLPADTDEALAFAVFAPMAETIRRHAAGRPVVLTGGDAEILASVLPEARIDETVVFRGMKQMIKDDMC